MSFAEAFAEGSLIGRLTREIEERESAGVTVREIELSPRMWFRLLAELGPALLRDIVPDPQEARGEFLGVPIRKGASSWCCRSCGAPREESALCSYCRQPYDRITIDGETLS